MSINRRWLKLDNAAKIYPAASDSNWVAMFRESATLTEPVDVGVLEQALADALRRMPSFSVRLRGGVFWYYLESLEGIPPVEEDARNHCARLDIRHNRYFNLRVRYYDCRIAVEYVHTLSDGMGGMIFLKTLLARYLELKYGENIPKGDQILDCSDEPQQSELEDGFIANAGKICLSRKEENSYRIPGTREIDRFVNLTTGIIDSGVILAKAHEKHVSVTEYLGAALILSISNVQKRLSSKKKLDNVKVSLPVNLRGFFKCKTLRNFASYVNVGINPNYGDFTFDEVLTLVHHQMGIELNVKTLQAKFTTNVNSERNIALRLVPLFLKNLVMKAVFYRVGDIKTSSTISNLGVVNLPPEMSKYVDRMDFILGPLSRNPVACGALTYGGKLYLNFTRTTEESIIEQEFFTFLVKQGIPVLIESNRRENECLTV